MGPNPKIDNFISARYGLNIRLLLLSLMAFLLHPGLLNGQSSEPPNTIIESVVANERQASYIGAISPILRRSDLSEPRVINGQNK